MATTTTTTPRTRTPSSNGAAPAHKPGEIIIPGSSSEAHALVNEMRALHSTLHGGTADVAAFYKAKLPAIIAARGGARSGLFGIDATLAARRVVKPLHEAAKLEDENARLWVTFWIRYQEHVLNIRPGQNVTGYDVDG